MNTIRVINKDPKSRFYLKEKEVTPAVADSPTAERMGWVKMQPRELQPLTEEKKEVTPATGNSPAPRTPARRGRKPAEKKERPKTKTKNPEPENKNQ